VTGLSPGDLAQIVKVDGIEVQAGLETMFGKTVVLIAPIDPNLCWWADRALIPYWNCAGAEGIQITWKMLKKIPPAPMEREVLSEEELLI
jgi:hypothetical protein